MPVHSRQLVTNTVNDRAFEIRDCGTSNLSQQQYKLHAKRLREFHVIQLLLRICLLNFTLV